MTTSIIPTTATKFVKAANKFLAPTEMFPGVTPELYLARNRVGLYDTAPASGTELDIPGFVSQVKTLEGEMNGQLIKMKEAIHVLMLGLVTGDNPFYLSLPGNAKTTMARMLGTAVEGEFFRKNFVPDLSASDLFGPISGKAMKGDNGSDEKWTRNWSGLAKATIALLDEFYKGSQTIQNNTLDVAEERTVSDPHDVYNVPLLCMIGASNEVTGAEPRSATWDRWMYRVNLSYPNRQDDIFAALSASGGRKPITVRIAAEDVMLVQAMVEYMSMNLSDPIKTKMAEILVMLGKEGIEPSPRRWFGWARACVAETLLTGGSAVKSPSLMTGVNILWIRPEEADKVLKIVGGTSSPERAIIMAVQADIEGIRNKISSLTDMNEIAQCISAVKSHTQQVERRITNSEFEDDKTEILADLQRLTSELVQQTSEAIIQKSAK